MTKLIKVSCVYCKIPVYRSRGRVNEGKKFAWKIYCSLECQARYGQKRKFLVCGSCSKTIERNPSEISPHNYCSASCAAKINNVKFPKRRAREKACSYKKCQKKFKEGKNKLYCSMQCRRNAESERKQTPEELISAIAQLATVLGRTPARRELGLTAYKCAATFGSWNKAIVAAGLKPNRSHDNRMYKRMPTKADDGHLCDSSSEAIVDNWLHENGVAHERYRRYPEGNYKTDWVLAIDGKTVFVEYFGLANDSPRYDRSIKKKQNLCRKYGIDLIEIYPRDLYPQMKIENVLKEPFTRLGVPLKEVTQG